MKRIKENEYFEVGGTIFQYLIIEGKHKLIPTKKVVKKEFIPPSEQDVKDFFKKNGYSEEAAIKFHQYYSAAQWKDGKGNQVKNYKQKAIGVWFKEENKIKTPILNNAPQQGINFFQ